MKTKTKSKTKNATKLAGWRAKLVADGGRVITTALSAEAAVALDKLKARTGRNTRAAIEELLKTWGPSIGEGGAP